MQEKLIIYDAQTHRGMEFKTTDDWKKWAADHNAEKGQAFLFTPQTH